MGVNSKNDTHKKTYMRINSTEENIRYLYEGIQHMFYSVELILKHQK